MIRYRGVMIDRERRLVAHGGVVMAFPRLRYRLVEALICAGPSTNRELFEIVYHNREDGGPRSGVNIIEVLDLPGAAVDRASRLDHSVLWAAQLDRADGAT